MSAKWRLIEAAIAGTILPAGFATLHLITNERPLITEMECGAIGAIVYLRLMDALHLWANNRKASATPAGKRETKVADAQ